MERLVLLLLGMAYVCDARLVHYNSNGFAVSGSEESEEEIDNGSSCGMVMSAGGQFKLEKRITIGGTESKYIEFPWMVALFSPKREYLSRQCAPTDSYCWSFRCGASLISWKAVLTAAICVYPYRQHRLKARAGDWNLDTFDEQHPYQERLVTKSIIHPQFHDSQSAHELTYDVALLIVESPFTSAENIGFICLPPPDLNIASANCKAAGWGVKTFMANGYQQLLQVVDMNYVDHDQCQSTLRQMWWARFSLHNSFTCAGGVLDKDTCQGDGGSPLMCLGENHFYARGLTSWGVGCGRANMPGVYTDVVKVRNWIDEQMIANGLKTDTYTYVPFRK